MDSQCSVMYSVEPAHSRCQRYLLLVSLFFKIGTTGFLLNVMGRDGKMAKWNLPPSKNPGNAPDKELVPIGPSVMAFSIILYNTLKDTI